MQVPLSSPYQTRVMVFEAVEPPFGKFEKPCQVCVSHKPNADGYLYKTWKSGGLRRKEPFHRFILRAHLGWEEWPLGLEVDHKCRNRMCCEPSHLRAIQISDHKKVTNAVRYEARNEEARLHWMVTRCTGTELGEKFGVTFSTGCRWIRDWRAEDAAEELEAA